MAYTYETVIIFDPTKSETKDYFKEMIEEISRKHHKKIRMDDVGTRKLAYPLKDGKFLEGYYVVFTWMGTHDEVVDLERCMRVNDNVLKFITIRQEEDDKDLEELEDIEPEEVASPQPASGKSEQSSREQDVFDLIFPVKTTAK
jgi:small subunit ribosomal protein S6